MAESRHEQISAALEATLAAIAGDGGSTYWYTPSAVRRVTFFQDKHLDLAAGDVLYLLRPGDETFREEATRHVEAEAEFFLIVARQFQNATESPYHQEPDVPSRWQTVNRMVRDAVKALLADVSLGGSLGVSNIAQDGIFVDRARFLEGWALAEIRFVVSYTFERSTP